MVIYWIWKLIKIIIFSFKLTNEILIIIIISCIGFNLIQVYKEINSEGKIRKENEFYNNLEAH